MAVENYSTLGATTVGGGGYTAGSGTLNVVASAGSPAFPSSPNFRVVIQDQVTNAVKAVLKVLAIPDGTSFTVAADVGIDGNAVAGDFVYSVATAAGWDSIRGDQGRIISGALPSDGRLGDQMAASDDVVQYVHNGSLLVPFGPIQVLTNPNLTTFVFRNQGGAVRTNRAGSIDLSMASTAGNNMRILELAAYPATPYTITMAFLPRALGVSFHSFGPCFVQTSSGRLVSFICTSSGGSPVFQVNNMKNVTTFGGAGPNTAAFFCKLLWMRVRDDGTNLILSWSSNGLDFVQLYSLSRTAFLTVTGPDKIGWHIDPNNGTFGMGATLMSWLQT